MAFDTIKIRDEQITLFFRSSTNADQNISAVTTSVHSVTSVTQVTMVTTSTTMEQAQLDASHQAYLLGKRILPPLRSPLSIHVQ